LVESLKSNIEAVASEFMPKEKKVPFHMKLPYWLRVIVESLRIPQAIYFLESIWKRKQK